MKKIIAWTKYLCGISSGYRLNVVVRTVAGVVSVALTLTFVWLNKYIIDCVTDGSHCATGRLLFLLAMLSLCLVGGILLTQLSRYFERSAKVRMTISLSRRMFRGLMESSLESGRYRFHSGDALNRLTVDLGSVVDLVVSRLPAMVVMCVQLAGAFVFLALLSPVLAWVSVAIMPVCLLLGKFYFRRQRTLMASMRRSEGDLQVVMQEGLRHPTTLQSLEAVGSVLGRQSSLHDVWDSDSHRQARLAGYSNSMTRLGFILGYIAAFGWGVFSLNAGLITFGTLIAFIQLVSRLQNPVASLAGYVSALVADSVAVDRLMELDSFTDGSGTSPCLAVKGRAGIRVKNVSFAYEEDGEKVFSNFSCDFEPGSKTAIVGETGIGKSTLVKLFLGLVSPQRGEIVLYGEGEEYPVSERTRCNFVYVPQGNSLLSGTIRDNLLLGNPEATDSDLADTLHLAAADFVFDLPMGLDTPCDESGNGLSEGQAQRVAIARALLRRGKIMLFDEFNSALDSQTAAEMTRRIISRYPDFTMIFISHRTDVLAYCDHVLSL